MTSSQQKKVKSLITLSVMSTICLIAGGLGLMYTYEVVLTVFSLIAINLAFIFIYFAWKLFSLIKSSGSHLDESQVVGLVQQANSMMDVTKKLRDDQNSLVQLLNTSDRGCWIKNQNDQYLFCNQAFIRLTGMNLEQLNTLEQTDSSNICSTIAKIDIQVRKNIEPQIQSILLPNLNSVKITSTPLIKDQNVIGTLGWLSSESQEGQWQLIDIKTGIGNRDFARRWLDEAIQNNMKHIAVLVMNINQFTAINQELGFEIGDQCLKEVSKRLASLVTEDLQVARLDGDSFALLLRNVNDPDVILSTLSEATTTLSKPVLPQTNNIKPSWSAGLARYPDNADSGWELLHIAENDLHASRNLSQQH